MLLAHYNKEIDDTCYIMIKSKVLTMLNTAAIMDKNNDYASHSVMQQNVNNACLCKMISINLYTCHRLLLLFQHELLNNI